ncbi:MAG TPA: hypothetical protein VFP58_09905 [Candidatus Eisenbacteria bacterium]|nr:hypothetical protein [Candidatus Eisenbacteria bacterium]
MLLKTGAYPRGVTWGDVIEIAGVFLVLGLYAWVAAALVSPPWGARGSTGPVSVLFLLAFTSYALGHGIHVAANSIHDTMLATDARDAWGLATFWDEWMGHVPVDLARILFVMALLLLERKRAAEWRAAAPDAAASMPGSLRVLHIAGALTYGFIYFATAVEGQTVLLALPFCAALAVHGFAARSVPPASAPVRTFFTAAALVSLLLFAIWGVWQRGFPEFTRAGVL